MSELLALVDAESLKMLLAIFVVLALSSWVGSVIGRQQRKQNPAKDEGIKIVLGATLSLFGLLIGFLLSFAISGYNTRVSAEEHEAMALANAFQRTTLLPTTEAQAQAEAILDKYLASRIAFYQAPSDTERAALRMQSIQLQTKMWNFVSGVAQTGAEPRIHVAGRGLQPALHQPAADHGQLAQPDSAGRVADPDCVWCVFQLPDWLPHARRQPGLAAGRAICDGTGPVHDFGN